MEVIIEQISTEPDGDEILISYHDDNQLARKLYTKLGFVEQQTNEAGKITAMLILKEAG
jgi:hypothetical protein